MKITIDGITYEIGSAKFKRKVEIRSRFDVVMEDYTRKRKDEVTFYHFDLTVVPATMPKEEFEAFYEDITAPEGKREITLEKNDFNYTFSAYVDSPGDLELVDISPHKTYWGEFSFTLSAERPARTL